MEVFYYSSLHSVAVLGILCLPQLADRRQGRQRLRRRGPPRGPRPTTQDSQGEDKNEGSEGELK